MAIAERRPPPPSATWERWTALGLLGCAIAFSLLPAGLDWSYDSAVFVVTEGSLAMKLQWSSLFLVAGVLAWRHRRRALDVIVSINPGLIALMLFCLLSAVWSPQPMVTFKRVVQFGGLMLIGVAAQSVQLSFSSFINTVMVVLTGLIVGSVIVVAVNPTMGIDYEVRNSWRGLMMQKNDLGFISGLSVVLWMFQWYRGEVPRAWAISGVAISLLTLVMAKSSTSITISTLYYVTFVLLRREHIRSPLWLLRTVVPFLLLWLVIIEVFFFVNGRLPSWDELIEPIANIFGKNADLTGRTDLWNFVMIELQKHWVLGIGYGGFWLGPGSASQPVLDMFGWTPTQSHNGYIDMINELGVVGFAVFLICCVFHIRGLAQLLNHRRVEASLFCGFFVIAVITNFTESSWVRGVVFPHVLFVLCSVWVSGSLRDIQLKQREQRRVANRAPIVVRKFRTPPLRSHQS